ncbi:MAG: protease family protein [Solirubrobacterales bacterium]|nr:protease family protein [Solirubrobacterales bacterium]
MIYASLRRRFLAAFLDATTTLIMAAWLFSLVAPIKDPTAIAIVGLIVFSLWFNYSAFCEWRWGQTIGKNAVGIEVKTDTGNPPTWSAAAMRNLLRLIDLPLTLLGIGAALWLQSSKKQRLGDRAAHTVVTRRHPTPQPWGIVTGTGPAAPEHGVPVQSKPANPPEQPEQPKPPPPTRAGIPPGTWTPKHVVWGILALIFLSLVEIIFVAPFDPDVKSPAAKLASQALFVATLTGVAFGFATLPKSGLASPQTLGLRSPRRFVSKLAGPNAGPAMLAAMVTVAAIAAYLLFAGVYNLIVHTHQEDIARDLGVGSTPLAAVVAGLLIVVASPLSEEIFFRGFLFGGLRHRLSLWPAAAIAGAIFGAVHFTGGDSVTVVPQLAALGVILCWLYEKTGSIWPTVVIHVLNNALAFAVLVSK